MTFFGVPPQATNNWVRNSKRKNFNIFLSGKGFYKLPTDHASKEEHKKAAEAALKKASELVGKVDVLILDEVNNAVSDRLVKTGDLLKKRGRTHVVLTGRKAQKEFVELADLVTEMRKVKHPFDLGKKAVKGLDY